MSHDRHLIVWVSAQEDRAPIRKLLEIVGWESYLISTIGDSTPEPEGSLLLAVGEEGLSYLTGFQGVSDYQGSRFSDGEQEVVSIRSPSELISHHSWLDLILTLQILKRARAGSWVEQPSISDSPLSESLSGADRWSFDLEVRGRQIKSLGLAAKLGEEWRTLDFTPPTPRIWTWFKEMLRLNPRVVGHNFLSFDAEWVEEVGIHLQEFQFDTMLGFGFLYPELPKDLASAIRWFGLGNFHKSKEKEKDLGALAELDALRSLQLSFEIEREIEKSGRLLEWAQFKELQKIGLRAQGSPVLVNEERVLGRKLLLKEQIRDLKKSLAQEVDVDPLSVPSVRSFLYGDLKLPSPTRGKKRGVKTVDEAHLKLLEINHPEIPHLGSINRVREMEAELDGLPIHSFDGRSFSSVQLMNDELGDWSFSPSHTRFGNDLRRVQGEARWAIEAPPGSVFIRVSLKGLSEEIGLSYFPSRASSLGVGQKEILLGLLLLETREQLMLRTKTPLEFLEPAIKKIEQEFPVKEFLAQIKDQLKRNGTLTSTLGRRRTFLSSLGSRIGLGTVTSSVLKEAMTWLLVSPVIDLGSAIILHLRGITQLHFRRGTELLFSSLLGEEIKIYPALDEIEKEWPEFFHRKMRVSQTQHWTEE